MSMDQPGGYPPQYDGPQYDAPRAPSPSAIPIRVGTPQPLPQPPAPAPMAAYPMAPAAAAVPVPGQPVFVPVPYVAHDPAGGTALTSLITGLVGAMISLCSLFPGVGLVSGVLGIIGIVTGAMGLKSFSRRGLAIAGLVLSVVALAISVGSFLFLFVL